MSGGMPAPRQKASISGVGAACTSRVSIRARSQAVRVVQSVGAAGLEPAGEADVVGVVVGDDDARHRPAGEGAGEGALPGGADGGVSRPVSTIVQPSPSSRA